VIERRSAPANHLRIGRTDEIAPVNEEVQMAFGRRGQGDSTTIFNSVISRTEYAGPSLVLPLSRTPP
jgi:hypothetical protein